MGDQRDQQISQQEQDYNTFKYRFQQQIITAWKPVPYSKNNVILYAILTCFCIGAGIGLLLTAQQTPQIQRIYRDGNDGTNHTYNGQLIKVNFQLQQTLQAPVYLYYGMNNFYQSHRRYLKYFSSQQMDGAVIDQSTAKLQCGDHAYLNGQIGFQTSINGTSLDPAAIAFPCGQRAKAYIQLKPQIDSIKLYNTTSLVQVSLNKTGVSWPDDLDSYHNSQDLGLQGIDNDDQQWLVWYRPAAMNYFYKFHSIINQDLEMGNYTFQIKDYFNASFGTKSFLIGKSNYMGNKDYFLGIAFLVLGGGCLVVLIFFIAKCVTQLRGKPKTN